MKRKEYKSIYRKKIKNNNKTTTTIQRFAANIINL